MELRAARSRSSGTDRSNERLRGVPSELGSHKTSKVSFTPTYCDNPFDGTPKVRRVGRLGGPSILRITYRGANELEFRFGEALISRNLGLLERNAERSKFVIPFRENHPEH